MIHENRVRVALESELINNGAYMDQEYVDQINCILANKSSRVED